MKTLQEFLHEQAEHARSEETVNEAKRDEWVAAVGRLIEQMTQWARESDQENVLRFETTSIPMSEESLGEYSVPKLSIRLGRRKVDIVPLARNVLAPGVRMWKEDKELGGRVDLVGSFFKYLLYRYISGSGQDAWQMIDDRTFTNQTLTRETFESALVSLFG